MKGFLRSVLQKPPATVSSATAPVHEKLHPVRGKLSYLAATDIFRDLQQQEMEELDRVTVMTTCRRGRVFYTPDETGEVLFILKHGRVNIYRVTPDGRKLVTATIEPGTIFGEMSLIGQGMGGSFAEAAEDCTLCVMGRADLEHLIATQPQVALRLVELLAGRLAEAEQQLEMLAFKSVSARLAAALLQLAGNDARDISGIAHQELADMVGVYRETATRILNDFRSQGLIELHRLRISILDPEGLRRLADG